MLTLQGLNHSTTARDHQELLEAVIAHDPDLAEARLTAHLSRHIMEREELETLYPDYFL